MNEKNYPVVSSPRDPHFLTLRSLQTHQGRSRTQRYIIEGIRHLARAVEHRAPIDSVFLDPSVLSNPFGKKLARRLRQQATTTNSARVSLRFGKNGRNLCLGNATRVM